MLSSEMLEKLAKMARIEISPSDLERFQKDLSSILGYIDDLKAVDTEGVIELSTVTGLENVTAEDKVSVTEIREEILSNAPEIKDGYYKVKSIL